ncbi:ABC transporter permease [Mycobacterium alsense]|uniref:ABC transporter permease n=1 Tax=Mycobacterium alsense TaxID=324058 RepID=A0ABD6P1J2_9MYCO|nr:ABC transporter permease [Mycobacterium alsense]
MRCTSVSIVVLGSAGPVTSALADGLGAVAPGFDAPLPPGVEGVLVAVGDGSMLTVDAGDAMWRTLVDLQRAHSAMRSHGGRIVLLVPTIGMAGAAGGVAYTTAIEGIRAMAKSAARQWCSDGVWVNLIAAPVHLFAPGLDASHLTAAAFSDDGTLINSVVETAKFLLRRDIDHLVGVTIVADGGSVMLP